MKNLTPDQVAAKWKTRSSGAAADYAAGVAAVTDNPMQKAAAAADLWQQRLAQQEVKDKFRRKLQAVTLESWKAIVASVGQSRYSAGVTEKGDKYAKAIGPVLAYERAGLAAIQRMPNVTPEDKAQRAAAWVRYMAAYKGQG